MNSQANRKVKASSARITRFMPARKAGKNGSTRCGALLVPAIAEAVEARRGAAEIDHDQEEGRQRVDAEDGRRARAGRAAGRGRVGWRRRSAAASATARMSRQRGEDDAVDQPAGHPPPAQRRRATAARTGSRCRRGSSVIDISGLDVVRPAPAGAARRASPAVAFQPHATAAVGLAAPSPISSMPSGVQRRDQLDQGVDVAANRPVACLHPLDRRHRQPRDSASRRWSIPRRARAAVSCAAVIMFHTSFFEYKN